MQLYRCRDCHISCQLIISFLEIWTRCLQLFLVICRIICAHLTWFTRCFIWLWSDRTCSTCSIAVSFVLKSEVDMLKMWVHKRTRAENDPTNHYPKQILMYAWHTWCKKGTNGNRMSCSSRIGYMHIDLFKSIDFRTMGLWNWITLILIHTLYIYLFTQAFS